MLLGFMLVRGREVTTHINFSSWGGIFEVAYDRPLRLLLVASEITYIHVQKVLIVKGNFQRRKANQCASPGYSLCLNKVLYFLLCFCKHINFVKAWTPRTCWRLVKEFANVHGTHVYRGCTYVTKLHVSKVRKVGGDVCL